MNPISGQTNVDDQLSGASAQRKKSNRESNSEKQQRMQVCPIDPCFRLGETVGTLWYLRIFYGRWPYPNSTSGRDPGLPRRVGSEHRRLPEVVVTSRVTRSINMSDDEMTIDEGAKLFRPLPSDGPLTLGCFISTVAAGGSVRRRGRGFQNSGSLSSSTPSFWAHPHSPKEETTVLWQMSPRTTALKRPMSRTSTPEQLAVSSRYYRHRTTSDPVAPHLKLSRDGSYSSQAYTRRQPKRTSPTSSPNTEK